MQIEISDKLYEKLVVLGNRLFEQDNRYTATPILYVLQDIERMYTEDGILAEIVNDGEQLGDYSDIFEEIEDAILVNDGSEEYLDAAKYIDDLEKNMVDGYASYAITTVEEFVSLVISTWRDGKSSQNSSDDVKDAIAKDYCGYKGYDIHHYDMVRRYPEHGSLPVFLTEVGIKEHIRANNYHYNDPTDYVINARRNPEFALIYKFFGELIGKDLSK